MMKTIIAASILAANAGLLMVAIARIDAAIMVVIIA